MIFKIPVSKYIWEYHPYRGGYNPNFDDKSRTILDLKNGNQDAIEKVVNLIEPLLGTDFGIAVVPSHDPKKENSGIKQVARRLAAKPGRTDLTDCLERIIEIPKLAHGGRRGIDVHLDSIIVNNPSQIRGKEILLLDDVRTSGSSLSACEQLLKGYGAKLVCCLAIAQTIN
jgi:predicted amidophosphoribosyltransferase